MGSWERLRNQRQSLSANNTVMTELMFAGNFTQTPVVVKDPANSGTPFPGNIVPTNRLSPIAIALQQYYVKPSNPNAITQNFTTVFPAKLTSDQTVNRVDQNTGYAPADFMLGYVQCGRSSCWSPTYREVGVVVPGPWTWMLDGKQYLVVGAGDTLYAFTVAGKR